MWNVEYTGEFGDWYMGLDETVQDDVDRTLTGGNKAGNKRLYEAMIATADRLYDIHLAELRPEGLIP
jgi:hypothetical protein